MTPGHWVAQAGAQVNGFLPTCPRLQPFAAVGRAAVYQTLTLFRRNEAMCSRFLFPLVFLLLALCGLSPAQAGPWPRAMGGVFMSTSSSFAPDIGLVRSEFYAEFGLRPNLTLGGGFEVNTILNQYEGFVRWHPQMPDGMALGLTSGLRYRPYSLAPYQPFVGAEIGRGFEMLGGNAWAQAGVRIFAAQAPWGMEYAGDYTAQLGLRRGRWLGMLGLTHFQTRLSAITRLRPAVGVEIGRFTLVGELVIPPSGRVESLRLGLWQEF